MPDFYRKRINFYKEKVTEYEGKLVTVGLSDKDRLEIISILKMIYEEKNYRMPKEKYLALKNEMDEVETKFSNEIIPFKNSFDHWCYIEHKKSFDDLKLYVEQIDFVENKLYDMVILLYNKVHFITPREFILKNSILTHLVYTNNEHSVVKPRSADSYLFLCQFHREKTPSMLVNNSRNFLQCFGCGSLLDSVEYLMQYEDLTEEDAISVLANIYFINYPDKKDPIPELQDKYVNVLLSDDFRSLLERGYNRTKLKDKTFFVTKGISKFEQDFETIKRVSEGKYKDYISENKPKVYIKKD